MTMNMTNIIRKKSPSSAILIKKFIYIYIQVIFKRTIVTEESILGYSSLDGFWVHWQR
jgi:hypothetical protein